jgi:hypothetical protein
MEPSSVVIISDVHAQRDRLLNTLTSLGLLNGSAERVRNDITLVQIGDLIDGRDPLDIQILEDGRNWFDIIICGNHEAAYLDGPDFMGYQPNPTLKQQLKRLLWEDKLVGAYNAHGHLITHAGASGEYWHQEASADDLAQSINRRWREWAEMLRPGQAYPELFAMDETRGTSYGLAGGGVMWADWTVLLGEGEHRINEGSVKQIVGHSPRGRMEESEDGMVINLDVAGARLGVAVISPDGQVYTGADRVYE